MKLRNALLVASMLAAPAAAFAQPVTGPYISLGVGATYLDDQKLDSVTYPDLGVGYYGPGNGHIKTDTDIIGSAAVGYGLGNGIRVEINGNYLTNKLTSVSGLSAGGQEEQYQGFVNVLYDFDLTPYGAPGISPYIGVGAGYDQLQFQNGHASGYSGAAPIFIRETNTQGDFAAQGILGVAYNIAAVPGLALTVEGRVSAIPQAESFHGQYFAPGVATRVDFRVPDSMNYTGLVGLRYALFTPAPPPPPPAAAPVPVAAPAPEPARTYLVFFDWDRADLSARARQIVAQAAQASTHVQTTRIEVNGYTDLSGTAAYNQKLSVRRAQSVEAELVRDGVSQGEISIHGYGESNPLVPTAKGVREPQNRRVEIILK
jgi:outer membrane protein OmpA-like peptidoglycan-associated protein/opacity protein-like surface antigen